MWWTVPNTWIATGNGKLIGTVAVAGGKTQYKWKPTDPLTTYLVSCAATGYSTFSHTYTPLAGGSMPVDYYVYPEHLVNAQESFKPTPDMIAFFAQTFGEYPFVADKYGMTEFNWGGAMEHSTNTSYGTQLVNGGHTYDYIIAHELSHQWWGDALSPRTWANAGSTRVRQLPEALWSSISTTHQLPHHMNNFLEPAFSGSIYNPVDLFASTVHDKGRVGVHAPLRRRRQLLQHDAGPVPQNDNGAVDTEGYRRQATAVHDRTPSCTGQPSYEYGWSTADLGDGTYRTYFRIRQTQAGTPFTMPVDLTFWSGGVPTIHTVWNDQADQDFTFVTSTFPTSIFFDDNDWILKSSETQISPLRTPTPTMCRPNRQLVRRQTTRRLTRRAEMRANPDDNTACGRSDCTR
jgi:hypothetical protein